MQLYSAKHGAVEVLNESVALIQVRDADSREFWVRRDTLRSMPARPEPAFQGAAPAFDALIPWPHLVAAIQAVPYSLDVHTHPDHIERCEYEYLEWADELLSQECIKLYDTQFTREWRLRFRLPNLPALPFPVDIMGITGRGIRSKIPRGLLQNGWVHVYYPELIERFVREGLRATE